MKLKGLFKKIFNKVFYYNREKLIKKIIDLRLTYLPRNALNLLAKSTKDIENNNISGNIIETGCALGGSSILMGKLKKKE